MTPALILGKTSMRFKPQQLVWALSVLLCLATVADAAFISGATGNAHYQKDASGADPTEVDAYITFAVWKNPAPGVNDWTADLAALGAGNAHGFGAIDTTARYVFLYQVTRDATDELDAPTPPAPSTFVDGVHVGFYESFSSAGYLPGTVFSTGGTPIAGSNTLGSTLAHGSLSAPGGTTVTSTVGLGFAADPGTGLDLGQAPSEFGNPSGGFARYLFNADQNNKLNEGDHSVIFFATDNISSIAAFPNASSWREIKAVGNYGTAIPSNIPVVPVPNPEPTSLLLTALGMAGAAVRLRRKKKLAPAKSQATAA